MPPAVAERVASTLHRHALLAPGDPVLVLVSGGADSTLALVVLHELGHPVRALHVAHARRGAESRRDARQCAALAAALAVPFAEVDGHVAEGGNLEARLREVRRGAATEAAGGDAIATGHTATDQAETALYRLATSGGVRALPALRPRRGAWVRPLIELTRAEVRAELRRRGVAWRDDPSNLDLAAARNRLRHEVLPVLRGLNPAAERNLARAATHAAEERDVLDALAAGLVEDDGSLDLDRLAAAPRALARLALRAAADRAGARLGHEDVEALLDLGRAGAERRSLPGRGEAARDGSRLLLRAAPPAPARVPESPATVPVPGVVRFAGGLLRAERGDGQALDPGLADRLRVRAWRPGDRLDGRRRPCAELLARAHVPAALRATHPVVEADGRIVCLPGVAVAPAVARPRGILIRWSARPEETG